MISISTNDPILRVEELQTKFDLGIVSNSLIKLLGSYLEARIVQQLHYWTVQEYGQIINGLRWIYKPAREWLSEALIGFTSWQLRSAIAALVEKGILLKEHLFKEHHGNNFAPKNRTYYYSLNYEGLEEFAQKYEKAETPENIRFVSDTKQFCVSSEKQFCAVPQNRSENTSIKNSSKEISHPTLPEGECKISLKSNQDKQSFGKPELDSLKEKGPWRGNLAQGTRSNEENKKVDSVTSKAVKKDKSSEGIEEKVNQNKSTNTESGSESVQVQVEVEKPKRAKTPPGTKPKRKDQAPWKDQGQFKRFYRALIQALPIVANSHSPQGLAQTIIRQLRSGIPHSYWDDFIAGLPIGTSTKPEWEVEPGVPYPMFIEYLTEKIKAGNNTTSDEQTRNEVFRILSKPRQASSFWGQFKRSVVNVSEQVERDCSLGVSHPNTPVWTRERIEPSVEEAAAAGKKIMAVNANATVKIESTRTPQLESQGFASVSQSPPDPWTNDEEPQPTTSQPTLRELLSLRLGKKNLKGFMKQMPKVSPSEVEVRNAPEGKHLNSIQVNLRAEERAEKKPKTNIAVMSVTEINDYLVDPILRKQILPQLMPSDYELITNEYGDIIGVRRPSSS